MKLTEKKIGNELLVTLDGRLDASWSEFFADAMLRHVRNGEHQQILDAEKLVFLSSAGIRSLLILYKELHAVGGSFKIVRASGSVHKTLLASGFGDWLDDSYILPETTDEAVSPTQKTDELYELDPSALLKLDRVEAWRPWQPVNREACRGLTFSPDTCGIGIGAAETGPQEQHPYGEFAAFCGHLALQPPNERSKPDFLIAEQKFTPELDCIQALAFKGKMSHLLRFAPDEDKPVYSLSELMKHILDISDKSTLACVIIGEIDGLVGAGMIRSAEEITAETKIEFPEIRNWLRFSGERVFSGEQAMICGVVSRDKMCSLPEMSSAPELRGHFHAAVFPFHPLPNGCIDLNKTVSQFFQGSSPRSVMHLVDDNREFNALGESALIRGGIWFGATENPEVIQ